eukprot:Phypoly_transcript_21152.p1 GENE.Phypoly_transcript_21152~~Phypoly_transcript_21152.p1  ORF type:complete len:124 (+),score=13.53 Phypoly_transcript_21152:211-582(+)
MSVPAILPRDRVLRMYRRIFRIARDWNGNNGNPGEEPAYIRNEARDLFHKNMNITDPEQIEAKLYEAEVRVELGLHYRIPYPKPFYAPRGPVKTILERMPHNPYMDSYVLAKQKVQKQDNDIV